MRPGLQNVYLLRAAPFAELVAEAALADAGGRCNPDDARYPALGVLQRTLQDRELALAPAQPGELDVTELKAAYDRLEANKPEHLDGSRQTFQRPRASRFCIQ